MVGKNLILAEGHYTGAIEKSVNIDGGIISKTRYSRESNPAWHCHDNMHIVFVFQGTKSETRQKERISKKEGSVLFYHAGEMHRCTTYAPVSKSVNIELSTAFLSRYGFSEFDIKKALETKIDTKSLMLSIQTELFSDAVCKKDAILSSLFALISEAPTQEITVPRWALQLKELLHDSWNEPLDLQEISRLIGVHPVTISKNFKRFFSCSLGTYKRKIRIEKSISLIKESEMTLSEIAHFCHFADQSHFIRNFKKNTGFLPSDFRKF